MIAREQPANEGPSPMVLLEMISGGWMSQAIYVAAKLGVADRLAEGPKSGDELATIIGAHPDALSRLMRGLTSLGLCREQDGGVFELTPLGNYLRAGVTGSLRSSALHWGGTLWPIWGTLLHSVQTGQRMRPLLGRTEGFADLADKPEVARVFSEAMADITRLIAQTVVESYDFSGIGQIVDVGGGYGELLVAVLRAHPTMRGILFDLPHVVEDARVRIEAAGLAERCEAVPGDFFASVPRGAAAYLLKSILHNWNDDRGLQILQNCRRAMVGQGKLLLVERVLPERMQPCLEHRGVAASDLNMLVAMAGRERTGADFRALLGRAGFALTRTVQIGAHFSVIEAALSGSSASP
jgi:hypothetical protein